MKAIAASLLLAGLSAAQFPLKPEGVTVIKSKLHEGVEVTYKEPGLCETTPGVRSFAGYVRLPPHALNETHEQNAYPINTFYWFFESRKDPKNAPLAIWLNGGPGGSSLLGALAENGPCFVANDSKTTYLNPWSWNNEANVLFIDEPNQVGYSYDVLTNITLSVFEESLEPADFSEGVPETNSTFYVGTMGSQNWTSTANGTQHAAVALWHFAQTWFEEFPYYKPNDEKISLFTESYGGHYGPTFMSFWMRQNELIANSSIPGHYLHLDTLGIINGCIDDYDMTESRISFPFNNTYDLEIYNETLYKRAFEEYHRPGGVKESLDYCRKLQQTLDPNDYGDIEKVTKACVNATNLSEIITEGNFGLAHKGARFDITHNFEDPFPSPYMFGWLNQHETQKAFGVPVNHSWVSFAVSDAFEQSGDFAKGGLIEDLAYILDNGVKVALLNGDRDYACNWVGSESSSLRIPWSNKEKFAAAGYAPLSLDYPYIQSGGLTRQLGNLSFTRVYQAGHMVPSYQPEVAYAIFMRALRGQDIATGKVHLNDYAAANGELYATSGPSSTWHMKNDVLPQPEHECYVLDIGRCYDSEIEALKNGSAVVKDWVVIGQESTHEHTAEHIPAGVDGGMQIPLTGDW
ncbi:secreted carboxypeptidase-like protein [Polychaeton citri CBS 116435]|uniref:Carboxypeptidase n=1 Tax=Polychaeton citri CBS 116435 TaxID=1314669 RepID=A0A9P4QHH7_9PEZI|nr:secreted carboxypeptidase-like protein [Polychaeton citri CBS 116435]